MTDVDQELIDAARKALGLMGLFGLDIDAAYSRLLAAVDAKERARIDAAKANAGADDEAVWAWVGSSEAERP